jgi:hypothetical protein
MDDTGKFEDNKDSDADKESNNFKHLQGSELEPAAESINFIQDYRNIEMLFRLTTANPEQEPT